MKNTRFIGFFLSVSVLFAILFQSLHTAEHLVAQLTTAQCHHEYEGGTAQLTHQHHTHDHCFSCDYSFSSFYYTEISSIAYLLHYSSDSRVSSQPKFYQNSTLINRLTRGPPSIIVLTT